jgi:hypothetical protein
MILCMDQNGNIYQASSDHAHPNGVEKVPEVVANHGTQTGIKNPYLEGSKKIEAQAKSLQAYNQAVDRAEVARKAKAEAHRKLHAENQRRIAALEKKLQPQLVEEAVMRGMSGADFNQLDIKDAEYYKREAAVLQGMRGTPSYTHQKYIGEVPVNALEADAAKLKAQATAMVVNEQVMKKNFDNQVQYTKSATMLPTTKELYFASEEEAKAYDKMTPQARAAWIKKSEAEGKSTLSPAMIALALAAGYLVLG